MAPTVPDGDDEAGPLLPTPPTQYGATAKPFPVGPSGRGQLRFHMRQMKRLREREKASVYSSVFSQAGKKSKWSAVASKDVTSLAAAEAAGAAEDSKSQHSKLYDILSPKSRSPPAIAFQKLISLVIIIDSLIYIVSTEPELQHLPFFYYAEGVTSSIFLVEYVCRLIVCTEQRRYAKLGPVRGRIRYMFSMYALIDALATFPFFLERISGIPFPTLTFIRVFRLLRIARTNSYSKAMNAVGRVLYFNREILYVAALLGAYLVILTSILMYYLRPRGDDAEAVDDISDFSSIASTMVLSVLMLTGQGGPSGQLPWYTQCVVLLTGIFSVAMFAIPASMLTWGFEAEAQRLGMKAKRKALAKKRGEVYRSSSSSSSNSESGSLWDSTSDEEYMNIIGGEEGGEQEEQDDAEGAAVADDDKASTSLETRIEKLEQSVAAIDGKLDMILKKLNG